MEFNNNILLYFTFSLIYAVEFTSTASSEQQAFKLIRYTFNETLPCIIPQAELSPDTDVSWFVTNDTVKLLQIWPFNFEEDDILWKEYDMGRDNSLVIKKARLHHGGIYTCVLGARSGIVEAVIFRPHCTFGSEGADEKLECTVEANGPTMPNVTWLGGNGRKLPDEEKYQSVSSTTVVSVSNIIHGPFECRVSDYRLNKAKTACYRGGRITDRATTRSTTKLTTKTTTRQTTESKPTTKATTRPTTKSKPTLPSSTLTMTTTGVRTMETRPSTFQVSTLTTAPTTPIMTPTQSFSTGVTQSQLIQTVTTARRFAHTDHQVRNSTITTATPDTDSLLWIIVSSVLVLAVLVTILIALLLCRVKQRQKKQDYLVEKGKDLQHSAEVPLGLKYEKEPHVEGQTVADPMLIKKTLKEDPV